VDAAREESPAEYPMETVGFLGIKDWEDARPAYLGERVGQPDDLRLVGPWDPQLWSDHPSTALQATWTEYEGLSIGQGAQPQNSWREVFSFKRAMEAD
jgi:hypothetical protein